MINEIITKSVITCPECGHKKTVEMPTESCQFFYECEKCKSVLRPTEGDCCVYCSYGSIACPSVQEKKGVLLNCQLNRKTVRKIINFLKTAYDTTGFK